MRPVFDFNIHLPCGVQGLSDRLSNEREMTGAELYACFHNYKDKLQDINAGGNIMIFNSSLSDEDIANLAANLKAEWCNSFITVLIDFRSDDWPHRLRYMKNVGVTGIKFHSYVQQITMEDIQACVVIAQAAEELGFMIAIDTSYGSLGMYRYDNLRLVAAIAEKVHRAPIVLLHSGGARCIDAFLLAQAGDNIYLETSFSLPYYLGSSIERDLAYAYRKLGPEKIIYGSDFPYVDLGESMSVFDDFIEKWGFTDNEADQIAFGTANSLLEFCA